MFSLKLSQWRGKAKVCADCLWGFGHELVESF